MNVPNIVNRVVRSQKGQSLVELTLLFPFLILLLYGTIEFGNVIATYQTLTHATREGANLTSRGEDPNTALDAIIASSGPTIRNNNLAQWRIIYSRIVQDPGTPCPQPPCVYEIESQIVRGNLGQSSQLGGVGATVNIPGIDTVNPNQTFHAIEVYFDYGPNTITFIGDNINKIFYERAIFTNVS